MHRTPGFRRLVIGIGESINPNQSQTTVFLLIYQSIALHVLQTLWHSGITRPRRMGRVFRCTKEYSRSSTVRCDNATS